MPCTYAGAGTEWRGLSGGAAAAGALAEEAEHAPYRLPAGAVALLKGEERRHGAGRGCIHRSPPTGRVRRPRLPLRLDEPGRFPGR